MFTCDCKTALQMPAAHGRGKNVMVGLTCQCGVYWSLHYPQDALWAMAVRYQCNTCESSKMFALMGKKMKCRCCGNVQER
jgi:hypothetical protein